MAARNSPVLDEVGHLPAGVWIWSFGRFDVYRVNPPLVRAVAAIPTALARPELRWKTYRTAPVARPEWDLGRDFVEVNDHGNASWHWYFVMARWACVPLSLLGAYFCYCWASALYGAGSGLMALVLWCFCPNVGGWASTICPDAGATSLGVAACYVFWRWVSSGSWPTAGGAGILLGLALLTKGTWIVLFALLPILWLLWTWPRGCQLSVRGWTRQGGQLAAVMVLGIYVLNLGYAFEGSLKPLEEYMFVSRSLAGEDSVLDGGKGGNRFKDTWLASLPVPLPENYVTGIDLQKKDFEEGKESYLCGRWSDRGWWYYYAFAGLLKVPLGTWVLGILAVVVTVWDAKRKRRTASDDGGSRTAEPLTPGPSPASGEGRTVSAPPSPGRREGRAEPDCVAKGKGRGYWAGWRNELTLLLPAIVVFALVSSQTGFSRYFRYVLPCFPFVYIWISKVARSIPLGYPEVATKWGLEPVGASGTFQSEAKGAVPATPRPSLRSGLATLSFHRAVAWIGGAALAWSIASSLSVYPHSMSYFNELAGGPTGGHRYLIDANIDWGQDMFYLKRWLDEHPEAKPLGMAYLSFIHPRHYGIEYVNPPEGNPPKRTRKGVAPSPADLGPQPGWYAMSVHRIHSNTDNFLYFLKFKPVAMAGYSIYIYHITLEEANRVRRETGLAELKSEGARG